MARQGSLAKARRRRKVIATLPAAPPPKLDTRRTGLDTFLIDPKAYCQLMYEKTGNGLFPWLAYRDYRTAGQPIPEWILRYLDDCGATLAEGHGKRSTAEQSLKALALDGRGPTKWRNFETEKKHFTLALRVASMMQLYQIGRGKAILSFSHDEGAPSQRTLHEACNKYLDYILDISELQ